MISKRNKSSFVLTISLLSLASCFSLLDVKEHELAVVKLSNEQYQLRILHLPSNATIQSTIQVRQKNIATNKEVVLQSFERYNVLKHYQLLSDTALRLVLKDTVSYIGSKQNDTFQISIK